MSEVVLEQLAPGFVFLGRYQVVRCLKAGGMGAVYEVVHLETRRRRALKVMLPAVVSDPDLRARFRLEATITAEIETEHIVETFDAGIEPETGAPFLVMELLKGEDVAGLLERRGALPAAEVVTLLRQLAVALDKTHAAGIVHRDLKPENLFVTLRDDGSPRLKVLDFGIAKVVALATTEAHPGAVAQAKATRSMGTPLFMAPEQLGGGGPLGPRADLYAVGHVAYTMLVGQSYWEDDPALEEGVWPLLVKVMAGAIEPASARAAPAGCGAARGVRRLVREGHGARAGGALRVRAPHDRGPGRGARGRRPGERRGDVARNPSPSVPALGDRGDGRARRRRDPRARSRRDLRPDHRRLARPAAAVGGALRRRRGAAARRPGGDGGLRAARARGRAGGVPASRASPGRGADSAGPAGAHSRGGGGHGASGRHLGGAASTASLGKAGHRRSAAAETAGHHDGGPQAPGPAAPRRPHAITMRPLLFPALVAVLAASPARAQPARNPAAAEALFHDAIEARDKGDWKGACAKLDASMGLDPAASTLINIAKCHEHDGKLATAWAELQRALVLNGETVGAQRKKELDAYARSLLAALDPRVPRLTIVLRERPAGLRVTRDGVAIPAAALGEALPADPGPHVLEASAPGRSTDRRTVSLDEGKAATVELALAAAPVTAPPPALAPVAPAPTPAAREALGSRRAGAYVAGGIGLAGVVVGAVAGAFMLADRSVVSGSCTDAGNGVSLCKNASGVSAGNDAKTAGLASSVGWGVAVAGLAVGTALFVTEPPRGKPAQSGRWVLSVSASRLGLEGSW